MGGSSKESATQVNVACLNRYNDGLVTNQHWWMESSENKPFEDTSAWLM